MGESERKSKIEMSLVSIIIGACFFMIGYHYINIFENNNYVSCNKEITNIYEKKEYESEDQWKRVIFR